VRELTTPSESGIGAGLTLRHRVRAHLARSIAGPPRRLAPAELVVLRQDAPGTLTLWEIRT
jgi:hypothetical protein